jgi:predicted nucleotidyltransferase
VRIFYPKRTREQLIAELRSRLPILAQVLPLARVVLFGSVARGRETVASDIDLLIVYRGERREDAFSIVKKTLGIAGLEPHPYTLDEYRTAGPTVERMVRDGVVLWESIP